VLRRIVDPFVMRFRGEMSPRRLVDGGLRMGANVYVGRGTHFDTGFLWLISIGDDTTISAGVEVLAHDASTKMHLGYTIVRPVAIGSRVFIGLGAIILPGVTIGDGAIVGAGSVVRHDVPAGTVVAGNPAREITTVDRYIERHRELMALRPVYRDAGWTQPSGITVERMEAMARDLEDGPGYVD
jgi:maltose O-acetyltransferase